MDIPWRFSALSVTRIGYRWHFYLISTRQVIKKIQLLIFRKHCCNFNAYLISSCIVSLKRMMWQKHLSFGSKSSLSFTSAQFWSATVGAADRRGPLPRDWRSGCSVRRRHEQTNPPHPVNVPRALRSAAGRWEAAGATFLVTNPGQILWRVMMRYSVFTGNHCCLNTMLWFIHNSPKRLCVHGWVSRKSSN